MSALDSIIKWAGEELLHWQSDAVRRLLQNELTPEDKDEIFRMVKETHGIVDPEHPAPKSQPLTKADVSGVPETTLKMTLKEMTDLRNVNALPDGSGIPFAHEGLTVIYGENASGKSGYARVLKKACKAKDTKEKLLPNVFNEKIAQPAQALFKLSIGDARDEDMVWKDGDKKEPNALSNICVFDSKCARVIVDENNEATYLPYGAHVFEETVSLYKELRARLELEKPKLSALVYPDIPGSTKAGKLLSELTHETKDEAVEKLAAWTEEEEQRLSRLWKQLAEMEIHTPEKQAQRLRNLADRLNTLSKHIKEIDSALSEVKAHTMSERISNLIAAETALAIVSQKNLSGEPLPGAGEKVWQNLYSAAKDYSAQLAYPGKEFPVMEDGSLCVLCMQPLELEARARMLRFKEFMEKATKQDVDEATLALQEGLTEVESLRFPALETYKDIMDEFREQEGSLVNAIQEYFPSIQLRSYEIIQAAKNRKVFEFSPAKPSPKEGLEKLALKLKAEAQEIEKASIPEEYEQMKIQRAELEARKLFSKRKNEILRYVEQIRLAKRYESCIVETEFIGVTLKGKRIITEALTPQLRDSLQEELVSLGAKHLPLNLKASGMEGETKHKLELRGSQAPPKSNLSDILSEGEHCVVAVAGFLAELRVANHKCPIVFDDPVCSLDHNYRDKIAKRLVEEARSRQVIIFTHDIAFLIDLESKAAEAGVCFTPQTVRRVSSAIGKCINGLPWHAMLVKDRIDYLSTELHRSKGLYAVSQVEYNREAADLYALLRETWEALVEELLLYGTIKRHGKEVQTQRLKSVAVETADYTTIHFGMVKCSEWMLGHDRSKALSENRPDPKEIQEDIGTLERFAKSLRKRHNELREKREESLKPKTAAIG